MPDIRYIVWHTARSGSNMLMSMLSQTGVAGIADYENCGFYVGLKHHPDIALLWNDRIKNYFDKQRTANGVEGCKGGMTYFDEMRPIVGNERVDSLLSTFTHHIYLQRADAISQAVSRFIARHTKIWSTMQSEKGIKPLAYPDYSFDEIQGLIETTEYESALINDWFDANGIEPHTITYEDMIREPVQIVARAINFLV